jgi:murein DD-endopeptidase MepM/ murein hydrolase activator NlpD
MKLTIYRPVKTNRKTQDFGDSKACIKLYPNGQPIRPFQVSAKTALTCPIGYQDFYTSIGLKGHNGEDWQTYRGEPCYFPVISEDGSVGWKARNEKDPDGGLGVDVYSDKPVTLPDGRESYVKFRFWHLQKSMVSDGEKVIAGQIIALCDSTGASSGDHLHFAMKLCDMSGNSIETYNGYTGCVDFAPMFKNFFIGEAQKAITAYSEIVTSMNEGIKKRELYFSERLALALRTLYQTLFNF